MTREAPAKNRKRSAQTVISSIAAPTGLPALADSSRPSSSAAASSESAIFSRIRLRSWGVVFRHVWNAVVGRVDRPVDVLLRATPAPWR